MRQYAVFVLALVLLVVNEAVCSMKPKDGPNLRRIPWPKSELNLKEIPFKIVHETYGETGGKKNWELQLINADGSNPINLTQTPDIDELYPHASPDGTKICFVADEGPAKDKVRNVYYMNIDGTGRTKVADNARQPCWGPQGKTIAYLMAEYTRYTDASLATRGLVFYDLPTGTYVKHGNKRLRHIYAISWSPDGEWFLATVHGGMGYRHAILAFRAHGKTVYDLTKCGVKGCRAEFSPSGKMMTWGETDQDLCLAQIDTAGSAPRVTDVRRVISCRSGYEVYHSDFSPDGKYLVFSHGPKGNERPGGKAPGWNICVADMTGKWVEITLDGSHNKEPDWVPLSAASRQTDAEPEQR